MRPGSLGGTSLVLVQLQYSIGASSSSYSQGLIIMGISLFSLSNNMCCMQPRDTRSHIQKAEIGYKWKFNFSSCTQSQYYPTCHWDWDDLSRCCSGCCLSRTSLNGGQHSAADAILTEGFYGNLTNNAWMGIKEWKCSKCIMYCVSSRLRNAIGLVLS